MPRNMLVLDKIFGITSNKLIKNLSFFKLRIKFLNIMCVCLNTRFPALEAQLYQEFKQRSKILEIYTFNL